MNEQLLFANRSEFREWLSENHNIGNGIWIVFGKRGGIQTINPDEALEEALCFGWIDGQLKKIDETRYAKKFTPRRKGSKWSERNRHLAENLIRRKLMTEHGDLAIRQAKEDGVWDIPKAEPISDEHIAILVNALSGIEPALSNFLKMTFSVRRTYAAHYLNAKADATKKRRLEQIVTRLNENKKPM